MDWYLHVYKRPPFGESLNAKTWATDVGKISYSVFRNFEILDSSNELVAEATTKWVFLNIEDGKLDKITPELIALYNPEGSAKEAEKKILKLKEPNVYENICEYKVNRADIDVNKHMHNLNYLNLAYEALPEEIYNSQELNDVHIMYKHQIKLGDVVKCFYHCEGGEHTITIKSEDEKTLHAIVVLK